MACYRDSDYKIWMCHNDKDDMCSNIQQILSPMVNWLIYLEVLSLETSEPFSSGRKTTKDWARFHRLNCQRQITSSPPKMDTCLRRTMRAVSKVSVSEGVHRICIQNTTSSRCLSKLAIFRWPILKSLFTRSDIPFSDVAGWFAKLDEFCMRKLMTSDSWLRLWLEDDDSYSESRSKNSTRQL